MEPNENKYYDFIVSKTYFDCYSYEFRKKTTRDKLLTLALYLKDGGDLHYAIDNYKSDKSDTILMSLIPTLLLYIGYLRTGNAESLLNVLLKKYLSEYQLISLLSAELKANLNYSFEDMRSDSPWKKIYRIDIGEYNVDKFFNQTNLTKKELLLSIIKGNLPDDFDIGEINEDVEE